MTALPIYYKKVWIKAIVRLESVESFHPGRSRINLYLFAYMQKRTQTAQQLSGIALLF